MSKKHQIKVSSKKGRGAAGRKWRRQAKERLSSVHKSDGFRMASRKQSNLHETEVPQLRGFTLGELVELLGELVKLPKIKE